ncbi:DUF2752 domain-containing protein [Granulicella sp. L60]|uniref:DUF2752 domain-containing protein n=1 Tax=Granulicella sp. L60 TaxID=1641866 RepID=UPI001C20C0F7|nr:DUF2752 domain-containing protein [Granulicella sp. L60]
MITRSRLAAITRAAAPPAAVALAAAVLLRYPPNQSTFYPRCPFYQYLHLQCPGCGATRAIAALLRGHLREALHLNALITLALPVAIVYTLAHYRRLLQRKPIQWPDPPPALLYTAITLAAVFAILRNLPPRLF